MSTEIMGQIAIGLVVIGGYYFLKQPSKKNKARVLEMINSGAKIIDVRTPAEFSAGHYEGAVNVPLDTLSSKLKTLGEKSQQYVLYCASGARSANATHMMTQDGFTQVVNAGGLGAMPRK